MAEKIQLRRDTASNWTSNNPTLSAGEVGVETDSVRIKIGDGQTTWTSLAYFGGITSINVANFSALPASGSYLNQLAYCRASQGSAWLPGTLGGSYYPEGWYLWNGEAWVSDRNAIANAIESGLSSGGASTVNVVSNVASGRILGRVTSSEGDSEELTAEQVRTLLNVSDGATPDMSGSAIKTAYEAEADTNAFTDAEQTKLGFITVTENVDLDAIVSYEDSLVATYISENVTKSDKNTMSIVANAVSWAGTEGNLYELTLTGDTTLNNPSAPVDGATYIIRVKQDSSGLHTLSFGSNFKFPGGLAPAITLDADSIDYLTIVADGTNLHVTAVQNFL